MKPSWLKAKIPSGKGYHDLKELMRSSGLHTVCEEAKCPNIGECWSRGSATIMILGDTCTRSCGFCHIKTGRPPTLDLDEPRRVGEAARLLNLKHLVITSVNRDELPDGGAAVWAETIRLSHERNPGLSIEVLIPDFQGQEAPLRAVLDATRVYVEAGGDPSRAFAPPGWRSCNWTSTRPRSAIPLRPRS